MNNKAGFERAFNRRDFCKTVGLGLGAAIMGMPGCMSAQTPPKRRLLVGHTGITWSNNRIDQAIKDLGGLGYAGFETFGEVLDTWEAKGGLKPVLDANNIPLQSAYCGVNLTDPSKRAGEIEKIVRWSKIIKSCGGSVAVIGPNPAPGGRGPNRDGYVFADHKADIIAALNDICRAATDIGVTAALHPHTGMCIEKRDEIFAVLEAVDTKVVRFGPDVGQIQKGGGDPVEIVKAFLPLVEHVHLKDWDGGPNWQQYCPLGEGKVAIPEILDLLEKSSIKKMLMVELDSSRNPPKTPLEAATIAKEYLIKQGYTFRA